MRSLMAVFCLLCIFASSAIAQRDAPVWDSYLPRIVTYNEKETLDIELTWHKGGGPTEQLPHAQMYVLLYLEKDEQEILELAKQAKHTDKKSKTEDLIVPVLEKKKLATVLATKAASVNKLGATSKLKRKLRGGQNYDFEFSFDYSEILEKLKRLGEFDKGKVTTTPSLGQTYLDKVKLMIFVPVNDCALASLIPQKLRKSYDFAHLMDTKTSIHYFKPLPQKFQLRQVNAGDVIAYID